MARNLWIGTMAENPKKVVPRLNKDVREVIREMSKAPFGKPKKPSDSPKLTTAEAEYEASKRNTKRPLYIKREGKELTPKQLDKIAARISRERGIAFNQAKELLWKELSKAPISKDVKQPGVMLSKAIPTREQLESTGYRAVKYKGKVIFLSPGQVKEIAKGLGIDVEFTSKVPLKPSEGVRVSAIPEETFLTKEEKGYLTQEKIKAAGIAAEESRYRGIDKLSPEARAVQDRAAAAEAERLRVEAIKDWEAQAKAAQTDPRVRPPAEALNKPSPASPQAEAYADRLYKKAYQQLTPKERKAIKIIIEEEARRAARATSSKVGQGIRRPLPPIVNNPAIGGLFGIASVVGAITSYKQAMQLALLEKQRMESEVN